MRSSIMSIDSGSHIIRVDGMVDFVISTGYRINMSLIISTLVDMNIIISLSFG